MALGSYFRANARVGEGVQWSADRQTAWRLLDGQPQDEISLGAARELAPGEMSASEFPKGAEQNQTHEHTVGFELRLHGVAGLTYKFSTQLIESTGVHMAVGVICL